MAARLFSIFIKHFLHQLVDRRTRDPRGERLTLDEGQYRNAATKRSHACDGRAPAAWRTHKEEIAALPSPSQRAISSRMRFLSSLPTLVLGMSSTTAICCGTAHLLS